MSASVTAALTAGSVALAGAALRAADRRVVRIRALGHRSRSRGVSLGPAPKRWIVAGAAVLCGAALLGLPGVLAGGIASAAGVVMRRRRAAARADELLEEELGDAVSSIAAGLRAGLSLAQAIRFAADEGEPPLDRELRAVVDRVAMGMALDASLERWVGSRDRSDVRLVVAALQLHRRTGGDLPRVLDRLADTLRERRAARLEVRSLTAQARLSGAILGFLPLGFFGFLWVTSRADMAAAYRSSLGSTAIALGLVLQAAAFLWIRRLLRVDA